MIKNTEASYGWLAIVLHWGMALGVFFLFGLGLYMVELSYDAWYKGALDLHKSVGVLLLFSWLLRLVWRISNIQPKAEITGRRFENYEHKAAHFAHILLYILMISLMTSGYLISTADGRAIDVFGLFEVPALPALVDKQEDVAGMVHFYLAWSLIALVFF
mgnify:FL=1